MKIQKLVENLENTILGKQLLLETTTNPVFQEVLKLNLTELNRILSDVLKVWDEYNRTGEL